MSCKFCKPYLQKIIEGENGFCAITKNGELIAFPTGTKAEGVSSVKIKIKRCPMCGCDFSKQEKQHHTLVTALDLKKWMDKRQKNTKSNLEQMLIERKKIRGGLKWMILEIK